ncbi:hypothetical protein PJ985_05445 [Streptomyces sp. ACA25]|uniref:hypothetical protein n=1 Tax=Streptomyces sp. ACA25 TaxID=3022596 RepID=UPI00230754B9|nr:hypothetical protein [Streptomyces sp. ACA25]MDB1087009.1 hypothetical protein [Streptomyces sp. ACA25]
MTPLLGPELLFLADVQRERELDEFAVTPGVLGFVVFAVLGVAVWILLKSMNTRLHKVNFQEQPRSDA